MVGDNTEAELELMIQQEIKTKYTFPW